MIEPSSARSWSEQTGVTPWLSRTTDQQEYADWARLIRVFLPIRGSEIQNPKGL